MVRATMSDRDLFRHLPEIIPNDLPVPRIEIVRWHRGPQGFDNTSKVLWTVKVFGLNGQQLPKEDEVGSAKDAEHIASQWEELLAYPIFRLRRVVQSQAILEFEENSNE